MPVIPYAGALGAMPSPPYCSVHGVEIAYLYCDDGWRYIHNKRAIKIGQCIFIMKYGGVCTIYPLLRQIKMTYGRMRKEWRRIMWIRSQPTKYLAEAAGWNWNKTQRTSKNDRTNYSNNHSLYLGTSIIVVVLISYRRIHHRCLLKRV